MTESFNNWVDFPGYPGDQILYCEFGDGEIYLEQESFYYDQVRFIVKMNIHGDASPFLSFPLSGAFFFNELNAKMEVASWMKLARTLVENSQVEEAMETPSVTSELIKTMQGKNCEVRFHQLSGLVNAIKAELHIFEGTSPATFDVEPAEMWPKAYLDSDIAFDEAIAWLKCRNQYLEESP